MTDQIDSGSEAWVLSAAALVSSMVPSLAMFYGGSEFGSCDKQDC